MVSMDRGTSCIYLLDYYWSMKILIKNYQLIVYYNMFPYGFHRDKYYYM